MFWRFVLVITEILTITFWNYKMAGSYYSLDVLYCLPIIQAARIGTLRSQRHSDTQVAALVGVITAVVWSVAEAGVVWPNYPLDAFVVNIFTRSITFTVLGRVLAKLWKERDFFRRDSLTGLANRLEFTERFSAEQMRSEWSNRPYSVLYVEIDQFTSLNSDQDHHVGDTVLKDVAGILKDNSRGIDTAARIAESKFGILFPETDEYICGILALRIRSAAKLKFQSKGWVISLSLGHVTVTGSTKSIEDISREAEEKMHLARTQSHAQWDRNYSVTIT